METIKCSIENMKCEGCVSAIESALKNAGGVEDINVSLADHQATVVSAKSAADIAKVITDAGFPATPV